MGFINEKVQTFIRPVTVTFGFFEILNAATMNLNLNNAFKCFAVLQYISQ